MGSNPTLAASEGSPSNRITADKTIRRSNCDGFWKTSTKSQKRNGLMFTPSYHVAVVQLVEHQIVALVVEDSSSSSHPKNVMHIHSSS